MKGWPPVRCPGKVFLAGEYGVLVGGPALVMAVSRYATLEGLTRRAPSPFESRGLAQLRERYSALPEGLPRVNTASFQHSGGRKLGLGSSAAWATTITCSAHLAAGGSLASDADRQALFETAHRVHGGGSGADVASCLVGGVVHFQAESGVPHLTRVSLAAQNIPLVISGPVSVSTANALASLSGAASGAVLQRARSAGEALCKALQGTAAQDVMEAVEDANGVLTEIAKLASLGPGAGVELLETASRVLKAFRGRVKPSGAGGGELALAYIPAVEPEHRVRVQAKLEQAGLEVLKLGPSSEGCTAQHGIAENDT